MTTDDRLELVVLLVARRELSCASARLQNTLAPFSPDSPFIGYTKQDEVSYQYEFYDPESCVVWVWVSYVGRPETNPCFCVCSSTRCDPGTFCSQGDRYRINNTAII